MNDIAESRFIINRLLGARGVDNPPAPPATDTDSTGWGLYNTRTYRSDREHIKDWIDSLNTLLIFAALYSAILTAFIIESMKFIQEDFGETTRNVLIHMSQQLANRTLEPFEEEPFSIPGYALRVNYYFFASISSSLVAALCAVLALQWVGSYSAGLEVAPKKQALQRHFRHEGLRTWKMGRIIEFLPFLLFLALFLFLVGLVEWMWTIHRGIAAVVMAGLIFAVIFVAVTTFISIIYVGAPFRTPATRSLPRLFFKLYRSFFQLPPWIILNTYQTFLKVLYYSYRDMVLYFVFELLPQFNMIELWKGLFNGLKSAHRNNLGRGKYFKARELAQIESNSDVLTEKVLDWSFWIIMLSPIVLDQHLPVLREILLLPQDQFRKSNLHNSVLKWLLAVVQPDGVATSSFHLNFLRWGFERMYLKLKSAQTNGNSSLLSTPLAYVEALQKLERERDNTGPSPRPLVSVFTLLHSSFTLLLARNLASIVSPSERALCIQEVILMMWILQKAQDKFDHDLVKTHSIHGWERNLDQEELVETDSTLGWEGFFKANKSMISSWIDGAHNIPRIQEILGHISTAMVGIPEASPLWRVGNVQATDPRLFEALRSFDRIIIPENKYPPDKRYPPEQHCTLVGLICRDIEMGPPETFKVHGNLLRNLTDGNPQNTELSDPCLRMLADITGAWDIESMSFPLEEINGYYKDSWIRIARHIMKHPRGPFSPRIQKLQASAWPAISAENHKLCKDAIMDPAVLDHVRLIFKHNIVCTECSYGDGHMLLHLFDHVPAYECFNDVERPADDVLRARKLDSLLNLLILSHDHDLFQTPLRKKTCGRIQIDMKCLPQILVMVREVTDSRPSFIRILADVGHRLIDSFKLIGAEDIVALSIATERALAAPDGGESYGVGIYAKLLAEFRECIRRMQMHKTRPSSYEEEASKMATKIISKLEDIIKPSFNFNQQCCLALCDPSRSRVHRPLD